MEEHRSCEELFEGISLIADGETREASCEKVLAHMGDCEPCRLYLESLRATRGALGNAAHATEIGGDEMAALLADCQKALREKFPEILPPSLPR